MDVKVFDNVTETVRDDMTSTISKGSKVSIAAACIHMQSEMPIEYELTVIM